MNTFKCIGNENQSVSMDTFKSLGITFKDANYSAKEMARLSSKLKEINHRDYAIIPFCNTLEAETIGAETIIDEENGNRIKSFPINEENLALTHKIDFKNTRLLNTLKCIEVLKSKGERVCFNVTGPITLLTSIMDSSLFYKGIRKNKKDMEKLILSIEDDIVQYIKIALAQGADIISYADPAGNIDIVGPKFYKEVAGKINYRILKRLSEELTSSLIHICGKTSNSLENLGFIKGYPLSVEGKNYDEKLNFLLKEKGLKIVGNWCVKQNKHSGNITCFTLRILDEN